MLKKLALLSLIIVVLLAASYFWRDHYPWLQQLHQRLGLPEPPASLDTLTVPSGKVVVYRWQDAQGNWHFDGQPPESGAYERLVVDPDTNLMPSQQ